MNQNSNKPLDDRIIVVGAGPDDFHRHLRHLKHGQHVTNNMPPIVLVSPHESLTAKCRDAGYVITDMHGGTGVVVKDKKRERPKAMSLAQLFKRK